MKKAEFLKHLAGIQKQGPKPLKPDPVPYKHSGSTYDEDGIRITGSQDFIDSVLSRLSDLLDFENEDTRLQVAYNEAKDHVSGAPLGSFCCYLQVHERGNEAKVMNHLVSARAGRRVIASAGY